MDVVFNLCHLNCIKKRKIIQGYLNVFSGSLMLHSGDGRELAMHIMCTPRVDFLMAVFTFQHRVIVSSEGGDCVHVIPGFQGELDP